MQSGCYDEGSADIYRPIRCYLQRTFEDIDTVRCRHHIVFCTHSLLVTLGFRIENLRDADRVVEEKEVKKVIDGKEVSDLNDYDYLNLKPQGSDF